MFVKFPARRPRIAILRGNEWDSTRAIPRTLNALKSMGVTSATVLCWDKAGDQPPREVVDGIEIIRFNKYIPPRDMRLFLWWPVWWSWLFGQLIRGRFDLVHAMDVDTLIPAVLGRLVSPYRLIFDCRDALGLVLDNVAFPVPQFFGALERIFAPIADGILISQGNLRACAKHFGRRATRKVPAVQVLNVPTAPPPKRCRRPTARPLRINYSGYLSPVRGAFILADLADGRSDVAVDVVGSTRYWDVEKRFANMPNAKLHGWVPHEKALKLMDQADLIWLHYDNSLTSVAIASANKMFESMMLRKPYLTADGSWMAQVAGRFELGWSVPYGDLEALRELIAGLIAKPSLLAAAGRRGRKCFEEFFTWPIQRAELLRLYQKVLYDQDVKEQHFAGWARFIGTASRL